jgi:hypothetical protein
MTKQIQVLQNRILKILFNLDWLTPTKATTQKPEPTLGNGYTQCPAVQFFYISSYTTNFLHHLTTISNSTAKNTTTTPDTTNTYTFKKLTAHKLPMSLEQTYITKYQKKSKCVPP